MESSFNPLEHLSVLPAAASHWRNVVFTSAYEFTLWLFKRPCPGLLCYIFEGAKNRLPYPTLSIANLLSGQYILGIPGTKKLTLLF